MYEALIYENHLGERLTFGDGQGLYINESDLHNYSWEYTTKNEIIKRFYKKITDFRLPVVILTPSANEEEAIELKNRLMECAEKDVLTNQYGKIWIGDYYLSCYITASSKESYSKAKNFWKTNLTITTDRPKWIKEEEYQLRGASGGASGGYDYPYDYSYDYQSSIGQFINNRGFIDCDFRLVVYGLLNSINIQIGNNHYVINTSLGVSEYAVIDSREKKAYKVNAVGEKTNIYNLRDRQYNIFEKIPVGASNVTRDGFVDVILYLERSEPIWT